jgi:soluble lytic murein transglycosylase-like protein
MFGRALALAAGLALAACGGGRAPAAYPNETAELRAMQEAAARRHGVPPDLVRRLVAEESTHRPGARNGPYMGLMQIHPETARTMGYRGSPEGLLDPGVNLEVGTRYLRGAWLVAGGSREGAIRWYRQGYYYEARRKGLLEETGLR